MGSGSDYVGAAADLILSYYSGYTLDEIYDESPNRGEERGLTWPRVERLLLAGEERLRDSHRALAEAVYFGVNNPEKINSTYAPRRSAASPDDGGDNENVIFVQDAWWQRKAGS